MTKITKGNNYYLRQERLNVSMIKMWGTIVVQIEILVKVPRDKKKTTSFFPSDFESVFA